MSLEIRCKNISSAPGAPAFSFTARFDGYFELDEGRNRGIWLGTWIGVPDDDNQSLYKIERTYNYGILMSERMLTVGEIANASRAIGRFCILEAQVDERSLDESKRILDGFAEPSKKGGKR